MSNFLYPLFEKFLSVPENTGRTIGKPKNVLVVRQHNQLGDLLAGVSIFRAIKEKYPECEITLIVSPANYSAVSKNKLIHKVFNFNKKRLISPFYFFRLIKLLRKEYDVVIVPVVVSISFTSNLLARLAKAKTRIGPASLEGENNKSDFFFDRRIHLDWRKHPDSNVADRILDIVRPFGINTKNFRSEITFDNTDSHIANLFLQKIGYKKKNLLIGLHVGAGKPPNRWSLDKYAALIKKFNDEYHVQFYLTGSSADKNEIGYLLEHLPFSIESFINHSIPEVAALIAKSTLFICNDTGIMHVAGATDTPQISIFGPTNPFNWAPVGVNKFFIRKSELIDDVSVDDVYSVCKIILSGKTYRQQ